MSAKGDGNVWTILVYHKKENLYRLHEYLRWGKYASVGAMIFDGSFEEIAKFVLNSKGKYVVLETRVK